MNAYRAVKDFEEAMCDYTGAPYAVAVDSCTNALLICLRRYYLEVGQQIVKVPAKTYVGVAQAVLNAGHKILFTHQDWHRSYQLYPFPIIDSAKNLTGGMYKSGDVCLSFHWAKHLPIGRGGMILTDAAEMAEYYKRMRFDGRTEGIKPKDDYFIPGYHAMMEPGDAVRGLALLHYLPKSTPDLPSDDYPDLSKFAIFKDGAYDR